MPNQTEEQQKESQERIKSFLEKYGKLVDEMKVDFANYPMFVPDGQGNFKVIVQSTPVDMTITPQKTPFVA